MTNELPICELRAFVGDAMFCRHTKIRTPPYVVTAGQCARCIWRETPCASPRDVPAEIVKPLAAKPRSRSIGLGDIVAGAIKVATFGLVKPCGGCKGRIAKLNRAVRIPLPWP